MEASSSHARVWKDGRLQEADRGDAALTALCQAVEHAVRANQGAGVRAVILMVDQPSQRPLAAEPTHTPVPVYVDVFDSGFSQDPGYGHGI
ncbi:MAG: hypothetical protein Q7R30_08915 [Acidobacteriota bacterium]|nr:hypothetical protein [Acidobacteriota bacterium]